ncbi:MAG: hypothetical protein SNJ70_09390 [Armatimonadota bacterium]
MWINKHIFGFYYFLLVAIISIFLSSSSYSDVCADKIVKLKKPMPYRIVSFYQGEASKDIIKLAAELGFNGCMFQLEGGNVGPLKKFAERDKEEQYIKLCHSLGMEVTLWVHELSDIPSENDPNYLGPIRVENEKLWNHLEERYEWLFSELLPEIDGIVLTVVETQINATDTDVYLKLVDVLYNSCKKHNKKLIVRTFTWHPDELVAVMDGIKKLPEDVIVMSKCVPQDWQMRGTHNPALGKVGTRDQLVEYDIAGEYFLLDSVANAMVDRLKHHFDYSVAVGCDGICVRVDRWDAEIINEPNEINLWALGMFANAKTDNSDDVWKAYACTKYGNKAAEYVINALKHTQQVVTECLNIGSFTFGDTRYFPPNAGISWYNANWQNWRWDKNYLEEYELAKSPTPEYIAKIEKQKQSAMHLAEASLIELEIARIYLSEADYEMLKVKLLSNKLQLGFRAPMMLSVLKFQRMVNSENIREKQILKQEIKSHILEIESVLNYPLPDAEIIEYNGKVHQIGLPKRLELEQIKMWIDKMNSYLENPESAFKK